MKQNIGKLSLKEKILLVIILGVDKDRNVPFNDLSFPFAPEMSMDRLVNWISSERTVFYSTVSRMASENLIVVEDGVIKLMDNGKKILATNFPYIFLKNQKWDGMWTIIVFNIKETERYKRDKLRNYLIKIKFAPISDGVWVSPHKINFNDEGIVYIEGKLQKNDEEKILLYHKIMEINNEYGRLCMALKKARNLQEHDTIPFLRSQFLDVLANDPQMPLELLPKNWLGEKARKMFLKT